MNAVSGMVRRAIVLAAGLGVAFASQAAGTIEPGPADTTATADASPESARGGGVGDGAGGLRVTPTRVVLEGRRRGTEIVLQNTGPTPAIFRIELVHMRMTESGQISQVGASEPADPGERFADSLVRFSPRQVELEPYGSQTVRIRVQKPANLEAGEYRSHLVFRAVPADPEPEMADAGRVAPMRIALRPVFGIAVPVIVRHGSLTAHSTLAGIQVRAEPERVLSLRIHRAGNRSLYGDVSVRHVGVDGRAREMGLVKGVAVYAPNSVRTLDVPLRTLPGSRLDSGSLRVSYLDPVEGQVLAQAELPLGVR